MSLDPIYGNLTNLVHENILPNQIKNAHFLPIGESVPDGIKVLDHSVSCMFFVNIHEPSCKLVDFMFLATLYIFLSRLALLA